MHFHSVQNWLIMLNMSLMSLVKTVVAMIITHLEIKNLVINIIIYVASFSIFTVVMQSREYLTVSSQSLHFTKSAKLR